MKSTSTATTPKRKNWLLAKSRQWHLWGGLFAGLFILVAGASGIILNYKKPIFSALGIEKEIPAVRMEKKPGAIETRARLTSGSGFAGLPVGVERALEIASAEWGDVPLERIELKDERGALTYKVKRKGGEELWVNAATGDHFFKGEYEKISRGEVAGSVTRQTDWGKIMLDLHTGKIGGEIGKALMTVAAGMLLFLTVSGVYMWVKPILIRRQNAKPRMVAPVSSELPVAEGVQRPC